MKKLQLSPIQMKTKWMVIAICLFVILCYLCLNFNGITCTNVNVDDNDDSGSDNVVWLKWLRLRWGIQIVFKIRKDEGFVFTHPEMYDLHMISPFVPFNIYE